MIKLIASDIDGTLLDDEKGLPENFDEVMDILDKKGITFCVASGRSYAALQEMFSKYLEKISFICDNGAYLVNEGENVFVSVMDKQGVKDIVKFCNENNLQPILCGKKGTWHCMKKEESHREVNQYYNNQLYVENLLECDDDIFKIAVFEETGIENDGYPKLMEKFGDKFNPQISGKFWCDIMNKGINKGVGLQRLQKNLSVTYEETMAFGDFLNDSPLLENAYYSYAVANAHPKLKEIANFTTGSNNENSVMKEILAHI